MCVCVLLTAMSREQACCTLNKGPFRLHASGLCRKMNGGFPVNVLIFIFNPIIKTKQKCNSAFELVL